jgi:Uma2 family endonuclease
MNEAIKQEFINGEIIVASPATVKHDMVKLNFQSLLRAFVNLHDLGRVGGEKLMISLTRNDYEPDVCFFSKDKAAAFQPKQWKLPAPDLVAEILSDSTRHIDRGVKFEDYAAHGVREYWIIDPDAELVEQYLLETDAYVLRLKMNSGILTSQVVEGFTIPVRAIFDENENLAVLRKLLSQN